MLQKIYISMTCSIEIPIHRRTWKKYITVSTK